MRRPLLAALFALAATQAVQAQHWNDTGPGRDLLSSTITDFETFRRRSPAPSAVSPAAPGMSPSVQQAGRPPIPILDWVPPPQQAPAAAPTPQRRAQPRPAPRPQPAAPPAEAASYAPPPPAAAPRPTANGNAEWERSLAERERELDRLRRILEEDRLRYMQARQPRVQ